MRVFELAKKLGMESKGLLTFLHDLGIKATNHMSSIEDGDVDLITKKATGKKETAKKTSPAKKPSKEKQKPPGQKIVEEKPAEKKPRMLLKKKAKVEEVIEPLVSAHLPALEVLDSLILPQETSDARPGETLHGPKGEEFSHQEKGAVPPVADALTGKPQSPSAEKTDEKQKKKTVEEELLLQKESLAKFKDKFKKTKKSKEKDATLAQVPSETRDWQDFKPIHKRGDRKAGRRVHSPALVIDITKPRKKVVKLVEGTTVKEFAELTGIKSGTLISKLMEMGAICTLNQPINLDAASLIAEGAGIKIETVLDKTEEEKLDFQEDKAENLQPRPPVVTIMGHVDHGKTSLLDVIRQSKVTDSEAGGITQHIGAYEVKVGEKKICFLDTPGHEAFTAMRARGARVTDIVILVVAADDGVMPQTIEAINHAKAANVPIIVAINKIDKPEANVDRIKNSLSEYQLISEAWGGQTIFVEVSAKKKIGIETLLEMILLQAEVLELKTDPNKLGKGTIVEAKLDKGRGPVATA